MAAGQGLEGLQSTEATARKRPEKGRAERARSHLPPQLSSTGSAGGPGMLLWEPVWHRDRGQACTATPCPELLTQAKMGQHL